VETEGGTGRCEAENGIGGKTALAGKRHWRENGIGGKTALAGKRHWRENGIGARCLLRPTFISAAALQREDGF
jgi:hypothetical protein